MGISRGGRPSVWLDLSSTGEEVGPILAEGPDHRMSPAHLDAEECWDVLPSRSHCLVLVFSVMASGRNWGGQARPGQMRRLYGELNC